MTKPTIVTRAGKGAPLSTTEGDSNFTNLRDSTIGVLADGTTVTTDLNGSFEIEAGSGITVSGNNSTKKITIANSQTAFSGSYNDLTNKPNLSSYLTSITSSNVTTALGYTPEDPANKNTANGYAGLDGSGLISSSLLPSYVDDVIEAANYASLPGSGASGKIYVTLDTNKTYRWSGSAYVEISASPGSTDSVTEGSTNLYFTESRARSSISGTGSISYNSSTGVISYTGGSSGIASVSEDTAPTLGGNLTVAGYSIVSTSNGNIALAPNGTGKVVISGNSYPAVYGSNGQVLKTNGSGTLSWVDIPATQLINDTAPQLGGDLDVGTYSIKGTSNKVAFGSGSALAVLTSNGSYALTLNTNGGTNSGSINMVAGVNGNIGITPNGTGKIMLNGALGLTSTSGTPTTYNTSYFEGTLDTPAAWFKVSMGGSDYYLPMFQ